MIKGVRVQTRPVLTLYVGRRRFRIDHLFRVRGEETLRETCPTCKAPPGTMCRYPRLSAVLGQHTSRIISAACQKHYIDRLDTRLYVQ